MRGKLSPSFVMCSRCQLQALLRLELFKSLPTDHLDSSEAELMVEEVRPVVFRSSSTLPLVKHPFNQQAVEYRVERTQQCRRWARLLLYALPS